MSVYGASFSNSRVGWVTGTVSGSAAVRVALTLDGGRHWRATPAPEINEPTGSPVGGEDVLAVSRRIAYLYGSRTWLSLDSGRGWQRVDIGSRVRRMIRVGDQIYAVSDGSKGALTPVVWRSAVGGSHWTVLRPPFLPSMEFAGGRGVLIDLHPGLITSGHGRVGSLWVSRDRGDRWFTAPMPCTPHDGAASALTIAQKSPATWYLDCFDSQQTEQATQTKHHLFVTTSAGQSWRRASDPSTTGDPIQLVADHRGDVVFTITSGLGQTVRTSPDRGRSWRTSLAAGDGFLGPDDLQLAGTTAEVVITRGPNEHGVLYRSAAPYTMWRPIPVVLHR
jgi:hypothetical protein